MANPQTFQVGPAAKVVVVMAGVLLLALPRWSAAAERSRGDEQLAASTQRPVNDLGASERTLDVAPGDVSTFAAESGGEAVVGPGAGLAKPGCHTTTNYKIVAGGDCLGQTNCRHQSVNATTRIFRDGVVSACPGKTCPGNIPEGPMQYNIYEFTANACQCVTVTHTTQGCAEHVFAAAYAGTVTDMNNYPANCLPHGATRFLGDHGFSILSPHETVSFSFCLAPGETTFSVAVQSIFGQPPAPGCLGSIAVACAPCDQIDRCIPANCRFEVDAVVGSSGCDQFHECDDWIGKIRCGGDCRGGHGCLSSRNFTVPCPNPHKPHGTCTVRAHTAGGCTQRCTETQP